MTMSVGPFTVATTVNEGHSPEYYTERLCNRLIHISATAPPEIRQQALAYREAIQSLVLDTIRRAILSNHTTVIYQLQKAGMNDAAALVHSFREIGYGERQRNL